MKIEKLKITVGLFNVLFYFSSIAIFVITINIGISITLLFTQGMFSVIPQLAFYAITIVLSTGACLIALREGRYIRKAGAETTIHKFELKYKSLKIFSLSIVVVWVLLIVQIITHL